MGMLIFRTLTSLDSSVILQPENNSLFDELEIRQEVHIQAKLVHENVVQLVNSKEEGQLEYLVFEYCEAGVLSDYLNTNVTTSFTKMCCQCFAKTFW